MSTMLRKNQKLFGSLFLVLSLLLLGFNGWLRFFSLAGIVDEIQLEKRTVKKLQEEQENYLKGGLRDLFSKYSDGVLAVSSVLAARDAVFSGELDSDSSEPVMILDYVEFFESLQKLLGKETVVSNLNINKAGQISFLAQTTSYLSAARQITALRIPELLINVQVSGVGKNDITGSGEELPLTLQENSATYDFIVQAMINPEYFFNKKEKNP